MSKAQSPLKAIREYCLDCSNHHTSEVTNCTIKNCPLYEWRFGKNPYRKKREVSKEQIKKMQAGRRLSRK